MTSEHYFQAQKFAGTEYEEIIRLLDNPMKAVEMGRNRDVLISSGKETIIEKTTDDYYWGCGKDGSGINMLGIILMEVREEFSNRMK